MGRLAEGEEYGWQLYGGDVEVRYVPRSTFSHPLKTLRKAGLIRNEPAGRRRTVTLRRAELDERFPGLLEAVLR